LEQIKSLRRGERFEMTKLAEQRGTKIITKYDIKVLPTTILPDRQAGNPQPTTNDNFYELMLTSCRDAVKIQNELGGLMDAKSLAVTLFIARSRLNEYQ